MAKQQKQESLFTNYRFYLGISIIELIIIIILAVMLAGSKGKDVQDETDPQPNQEESLTSEEDTDQTEPEAEPEPENNLEENSHASIDRLVEKYCSYIADGDADSLEEIVDMLTDEEKEKIRSRAAVIESFDNVTCYTKNGPVEDSYIVFVCYDMKLVGIETSAPDIICLYVGPKGDGGDGDGRRIHYGTIDEDMQAYVAELEKDPDVQALYDDVSTRYQEAQENDETLAAFVQRLNGQIEEPEETPEEEEASEEPEEEPAEESGGATPENREIQLTETVNIRSDTSTDAEKLTVAYQGDMITLVESYENGWTKVEYRGITGYAKTEFLH